MHYTIIHWSIVIANNNHKPIPNDNDNNWIYLPEFLNPKFSSSFRFSNAGDYIQLDSIGYTVLYYTGQNKTKNSNSTLNLKKWKGNRYWFIYPLSMWTLVMAIKHFISTCSYIIAHAYEYTHTDDFWLPTDVSICKPHVPYIMFRATDDYHHSCVFLFVLIRYSVITLVHTKHSEVYSKHICVCSNVLEQSIPDPCSLFSILSLIQYDLNRLHDMLYLAIGEGGSSEKVYTLSIRISIVYNG